MKTKKKNVRILAAMVAAVLFFIFAGCGEKEEGKTPQVSSSARETEVQEEDTQTTQEIIVEPEVPDVEMCWSCRKAPVAGTSNYCVNCKCMICNERRKTGNYMYCSQHNCNVYGCAAMAVDHSQYCVSHKCAMPNCRNQAWSGSQYCAVHR